MLKEIQNKYKNINITVKAAFWFILCSVIQKSISFITVPIFTRMMSPSEYGIYSTYLSWYSIIIILCSLNMYSCVYINQYTKEEIQEKKKKIVIPMLSLSLVISFTLFIVYLIFHNYINSIIKLPTILISFLFFQIIFEVPVSFWLIEQRFEYKYKNVLIQTIFLSLANSLLGVLFVSLSQNNQAIARVFSIILTQFILGSVIYYIFYKRCKLLFSTKGWKHILSVQLPLLPHSLSMIVLSASDRIMINSLINSTAAAIYNVAYSIGYITNIIQISILDAVKPQFYKKIKEKNLIDLKSTLNLIIVLLFAFITMFLCFAPELIRIMAPKEYYQAIYVIPPVAFSTFFIFLYNIFSVISFYFEKSKTIMLASIVSAVTNIILNYVLIPKYGFVAAGYTTLISYCILATCHYFIMIGVCKEKSINPNHLNMKCVIFLSIVSLIFTFLFNYAYKYSLIRLFLIIMMAIAILSFRKKISKIAKIIIRKEK